jgi:hypothetical protein
MPANRLSSKDFNELVKILNRRNKKLIQTGILTNDTNAKTRPKSVPHITKRREQIIKGDK